MDIPQPRQVLLAQASYYLATGVAPFVSRRAFEWVTGRKREWWLVQTTGALVTAVGAGLLSSLLRRQETPEMLGVAAGCAAGLAAIDLTYVARRRISPVYLLDGALQVVFAAGSLGGVRLAATRTP